VRGRSDHCPAMKGIETKLPNINRTAAKTGSDHCPAMKGIETHNRKIPSMPRDFMKRPLPRNEGD